METGKLNSALTLQANVGILISLVPVVLELRQNQYSLAAWIRSDL